MLAADIRKARNTFWEKQHHAHVAPASLVAAKESTALFNVAGMQQLIPYLMGKPHAAGKRLYNIQWCVRTNDIEDIGDERHLSYFEMMGNWSLGDYFKHESIEWSLAFLTNELWLPLEKIGATIFAWSESHGIPRDTVARERLHELGVQHIVELWFDEHGDSDNFWIAGSEWPCGPSCEFFFDRGDARGPADWNLGTNDRYIEVWNNVFMEFYKHADGSLTQLPQQNVDTGMGFERITMVLQWKETIFETDIFAQHIATIEACIGKQYPPYHLAQADQTDLDVLLTRSFRIITDHTRSAIVLLRDGVSPSNEWRGYVLRRLIRRMFYHLQKISDESIAWKRDAVTLDTFFGQLVQATDTSLPNTIASSLSKECLNFQETIRKGQKIIDTALSNAAKTGKLDGQFVFQAYDTYGIPVELLAELAQQQHIALDMKWYAAALEKARTVSRDATKQKFSKGTDWSAYISDITPTVYTGYQNPSDTSMALLKDFMLGDQRVLVFSQTPFYAEGGGEVSDTGTITLDDGEVVRVMDVQKSGWVYLHLVS
jgi:alanyl-tRNA synthetase